MRGPFAVLLGVLLLAGCGEGDQHRAAGSTVRVTADEFHLTPERIVVQGPRVKLVLHNAGRLTHNVKVLSTTEFDSEDKPINLGGTMTAHTGETVSETVKLQPGTYRLACSIQNHDDLGEHAELVVEG